MRATEAAPQGPRVQNTANSLTPPSREGYRAARYARRSTLWRESSLPRLRACGRHLVSVEHGVQYRLVAGVAGLAGLQSCGSVWACPVCSAKIAARRAIEVGAAVAAHQAAGGLVGFHTFTVSHRAGDSLAGLWAGVLKAWERFQAGNPWKRKRAATGLVGTLRLTEVTHGRNGWHVHLHVLSFLPPSTTVDGFEDLAAWMEARWFACTSRAGLRATRHGQLSKLLGEAAAADVADYFTKATDQGTVTRPLSEAVALEFTRGQSKAARSAVSTRPPFALLDDVIGLGDADALDLWHEYERASKGRRQLGWSAGLRQLLGLAATEVDDEVIAAEELGTAADAVCRLTADAWRQLIARPHLIPQTLDALERTGWGGLRSLLDAEGIPYEQRSI